MNMERIIENIRRKLHVRMDSEKWEEELHPRDENGQFSSKESDGGGDNDSLKITYENRSDILKKYNELNSFIHKKADEHFAKWNANRLSEMYALARTGMLKSVGFGEEDEKKIVDALNQYDTIKSNLTNFSSGQEQKPVKKEYYTEKELSKPSISDCNTANEISHYMKKKYGIDINVWQMEKNGVKPNNLKSVCDGIEKTISDIPELNGFIKGIGVRDASGVAMSYCGWTSPYDKEARYIKVNPKFFENEQDKINEAVEKKHWPPNTTVESIASHECAHALEHWLIEHTDEYKYVKQDAHSQHWIANEIVNEACENIAPGKNRTELIESISKYALTGDGETMAEAFGDCRANGENANPLSIEIRRLSLERVKKLLDEKKKKEEKRKR